jgi:hypothetical protein
MGHSLVKLWWLTKFAPHYLYIFPIPFFVVMIVSTMNTIMHTLTMQQVTNAAVKVAVARVGFIFQSPI